MDDCWTLAGLTRLVYGVPKVILGLPMDADPNPEIKQAQRSLFIALYSLLVGADTGPRLPTLLLSLGNEKVRSLITVNEGATAREAPGQET
jgi:lysyl-tRNA synthetase class 1